MNNYDTQFLELQVKNLTKRYYFKKKLVLNHIELNARSGECVGILGINGCGKSTLLSILSGILPANSGVISINGAPLSPNSKTAKKLIGYVPQENPLIEELSTYDNLRFWYSDSPLDLHSELTNGSLAMLGIPEFLHQKVKHLSGGMKKRLNIGCAISHQPRILLLDEPGASLDLVCKEQILTYLASYKQKGNIILLTTHDEQEINLCDRYYILKEGVLSPFSYNKDIHQLVLSLQ